ncbi:hypothetical protein ANCCAN_12353 [Ancylostoma caninum]|uniref:DNA mismatch repair protein Mlh1 C-terminal domain-containing protein n=1 Tax=Ancylostoma caninum TaxID=29170 RepID=A0A368GB95_ANCCA|nr:hypothetical protein ANCCAN_12353 [Ancylostoma caninum]
MCLRSCFIRFHSVFKNNTLIFSFGNFGSFKLAEDGANLMELLQLAGLESEHESALLCDDNLIVCGEILRFLVAALELLESQAEMLNDYFSVQISRPAYAEQGADGLRQLALVTLPSVIDGHTPQMEGLPALVMSLVKDVDWEEEEACFDSVSRALAEFFVIKEEFCDGDKISGLEGGGAPWLAVIRDLLVPRVKSHLVPPDSLRDGISRLADLHDLYKVFERC